MAWLPASGSRLVENPVHSVGPDSFLTMRYDLRRYRSNEAGKFPSRKKSIAVRICRSSTTMTAYLETSIVPARGRNPLSVSIFNARTKLSDKSARGSLAAMTILATGLGSLAYSERSSILVVESKDWDAYGALQSKLQTDSEWQAFLTRVVANDRDPAADLVGTGLATDVEV